MKRLVALVFALVILLSSTLFICVAYAVSADAVVCVTPTGEKYHKIGCSYIHNQYYTLTAGEAVQLGYTPCSRCKPGYPVAVSAAPVPQPQQPTVKQENNASINTQTEGAVSPSAALTELEKKYPKYSESTTHDTQKAENQNSNKQESAAPTALLPNWFLYLVSGYIVLRVILLLRSVVKKKDDTGA